MSVVSLNSGSSLSAVVSHIETVGPAVDFENYKNLLSDFTSLLMYADYAVEPLVNRVNYITHVVRSTGRLHDPDAPTVLDEKHPVGAAFVAKLGA